MNERMPWRPHPVRTSTLSLLLAVVAACGQDAVPPLVPAVRPPVLTGAEAFPAACNGAPQQGTRYPGAEVEPSLAVDPSDPRHLVAAWQADRWSNAGADGIRAAVSLDGGVTWTHTQPPLSRCTGGAAAGGDYERVSDPWVSIGSDGTAYALGLALADSLGTSAILVSRSADGGFTWGPATTLRRDAAGSGASNDKCALTVDPGDPARVFAVWDRLQGGGATFKGPTWMARSLDGGLTWEDAVIVRDPGTGGQTIGNQVLVLPDGALLLVYTAFDPDGTSGVQFEAMRSEDGGDHWTAAVVVSPLGGIGARDPANPARTVRDGAILPAVAVDRATGAVYLAVQDATPSGGVRDAVVLMRSDDGGLSWSAPVVVNGAPATQAFTPAVAAAGGEVAVGYYDFRDQLGADTTYLRTSYWLTRSADGGATWREARLGGAFDLHTAPDAGGLFLGDYTGLVAAGGGFQALFTMTTGDPANRTDLYLATVTSAADAGAAVAALR